MSQAARTMSLVTPNALNIPFLFNKHEYYNGRICNLAFVSPLFLQIMGKGNQNILADKPLPESGLSAGAVARWRDDGNISEAEAIVRYVLCRVYV